MPYENLREQTIEEVLNGVQPLASVASQPQVQSLGALAARLTIELSDGMGGLAGTVFTAKKQMVERMDALTKEIATANDAMKDASEVAARQTEALVRWTKTLVLVTAVYTLITGGLLWATIANG